MAKQVEDWSETEPEARERILQLKAELDWARSLIAEAIDEIDKWDGLPKFREKLIIERERWATRNSGMS